MKSSWSLTDTLNTDFDRGSLFDDLPEASNKMQQFTESKSSDKGAINKSLELSSVPSDQREQLEQMGSYTPSSEENKTASNPLDFVAPEKAAPQAPQEDDWTLGKYFSVAREGLQKLDSIEKQNNFGNATQRGVNKARFEAYKSQLMEELSDHIENKFGVPRAEVGGLFLGLSKDGSGYRSREEIDQIADIRKNGVAILDDTGNPRHFNAQSWDQAMELQKIQRSREIEIGLKKSAAGDPGKDFGQLADNLKKAEDSLAAARASGDERGIARSSSLIELLEEQVNAATEGKFFRDRHTGIQQNLLTALNNANNRNVNWQGMAYDQVDKAKPELNLSGNDYFQQAATSGMMPTVSGRNGNLDLSAAEEHLKKYGVESTIVGIWEGPELKPYIFNPKSAKLLDPILGKAPKPTGGEKPAPAEGNPFRAKAEESQIAQGTQDLEDRFYKIQDEMTKLDQSRTRLIDQRNQTEKPFPSLQGFPGAISAEKAADTYDEITAKMRELAKEKSELLEKRRAIKNKK